MNEDQNVNDQGASASRTACSDLASPQPTDPTAAGRSSAPASALPHRPIKFRAWTGAKMYYLHSSHKQHDHYLQFGDDGFWLFHSETGDLVTSTRQGGAIMQFTGLHDKNGKEIYEGDWMAGYPHGSALVVWDDNYACWAVQWEDTDEDEDGFFIAVTRTSLLANELDACRDTWVVVGNMYEGGEPSVSAAEGTEGGSSEGEPSAASLEHSAGAQHRDAPQDQPLSPQLP